MKWSPMWCGFIVEKGDTMNTTLNFNAGDVVFFDKPGARVDGSHPIAVRRKGNENVEALNVGHVAAWKKANDAKAHAGTKTGRMELTDRERMSAAEFWANKCHSGAEHDYSKVEQRIVIDPSIGDDMYASALTPGKIWHVRKGELGQIDGRVNIRESVPDTASGLRMLQEAHSKAMRDQVDAMAMALAPDALIKQICDLRDMLDAADPWATDLASSNSADVLEALHDVLGMPRRHHEPVDVVLPIDDSVECFQRNGARASDGVQPTPSKDANGFMKRYNARKAVKRPRRAPDGIMTLAPQSGFCSSGNTIYAAMPDD